MIKTLSYLALALFLISCSSSDEVKKRISPQEELKNALIDYKNEDYELAKQSLYTITIKYSGTKVAEDAQYYLGETNFKMDKYLVAAHSYNQIVERYTQSEYLERAQYKAAYCYFKLSPSPALDQKYTETAIKSLQEFISDWPASAFREDAEKNIATLRNKLAEKKFNTASLYFKMEKWRAARQYADFVIENFSDSEFIDDAHLLRSNIYIEKKQWVQAEQEIDLLLSKFPNLKDSQPVSETKSLIALGKQEKING